MQSKIFWINWISYRTDACIAIYFSLWILFLDLTAISNPSPCDADAKKSLNKQIYRSSAKSVCWSNKTYGCTLSSWKLRSSINWTKRKDFYYIIPLHINMSNSALFNRTKPKTYVLMTSHSIHVTDITIIIRKQTSFPPSHVF